MEILRKQPETVTLDKAELERALEPLMCLHAILERAGRRSADMDSDDVASVLGAILYSAYTRTGYPSRGEIL